MPVGKWFKEEKLSFDTYSSFKINKFFIESQKTAHQLGKADNRAFLWNWWLLTHWNKSDYLIN